MFLAYYASEASVATSPRTDKVSIRPGEKAATSLYLCEVGSEPAPEVATTADLEEEEEKEDENCHTHYKWKRRSPSLVVSPVASP